MQKPLKTITGLKQHLLLIALSAFLYACKDTGHSSVAGIAGLKQGRNSNSILFELKLTKGAKYYYTITTETTINVEAEDKKIQTDNNSIIGVIYDVLQAVDDSMIVKLTYDKIHIEETRNDDKQVMDAADTGESRSQSDKLLGTIRGSSLMVTFNQKGRILRVSGTKEITEKVLASLGLYDEQTKKAVKAQIDKLLGTDFIDNIAASGFSFYPDSTVSVGKSWQKKSSIEGQIKLTAPTLYTLSSLDEGIATIDVESHSEITDAGKQIEIMGQQVEADLSQITTGTMEANVATGMLIKGETKSTIDGTIRLLGKSVPLNIISKKELNIKKT